MPQETEQPETRPVQERFGHPRGLTVLAGTELWDRVSFHGMLAMLVLYMTSDLLQPGRQERILGFAAYRSFVEHLTGPLSNQALATQTFGIYMAMIALTPLIGGVIGDRWIGRRVAGAQVKVAWR